MTGGSRIMRQFFALVVGQLAGTGLGYVYWIISARMFSKTEVGLAAAAINTFGLIGTVAILGLGTFVISELPEQEPGRRWHLMRASVWTVAVVGTVASAVVWALSPLLGNSLQAALRDPRIGLLFVLGAVGSGVASLLDQAALAVDRSRTQAIRNFIAAALRFPIVIGLMLAGVRTAWVLVAAWVIPLLLSDMFLFPALKLPRTARVAADRYRVLVRVHWREAMRNHRLNLCLVAGPLLVPVVAALTLRAHENAEFSMAWLMATFVFVPPYLLALSLFAAVAADGEEAFFRGVRVTLPVALTLSVGLVLAAHFGGPYALRILGSVYASEGAPLLSLLSLAGLWAVLRDHLISWARTTRRLDRAAAWVGVAVCFEFAGALAGGVLGGARMLCIGWLLVQACEAVVTAPVLWRLLRRVRWRAQPRGDAAPPRPDSSTGGSPDMSRTLHSAGGRAVLMGAVLLLMAGVIAGILGLQSNGGSESLGAAAPVVSCSRTQTLPGPLLDLGVQPSRGNRRPPLSTATVRGLVARAKAAGAEVISTTASWRGIQPKRDGALYWANMDKVIDAARAAGLQVRLQAQMMPAWAVSHHAQKPLEGGAQWRPPRTAGELADWGNFIELLVHHVAGRVRYLSVWTEPNRPKTWPTGPDVSAYVRLLHATYQRAKSVDPHIQVISGGLSSNDLGFLTRMYQVKDQMYGASTRLFDMVGVNPYSADRSPLENSPANMDMSGPFGEVDYNFLGFRRIHAEMEALGDGATPLYLSSFGYGIGHTQSGDLTDAQRATYARQALQATVCYPYVKAFGWYYLYPTRWDPANWTLLNARYQPNLTYEAIRAWATAPLSPEENGSSAPATTPTAGAS